MNVSNTCLWACVALAMGACTPDSTDPPPDRPTPDHTGDPDTQHEVEDSGEPDTYPRPDNILLVVWDTVRADHLSAYGYPRDTTPRLTEIAQSSTVFAQATPGSYWTVSSVASLFSGMFTHNHRVDYDIGTTGYALDEGITTMAEALADRGYHTALYTNQALVHGTDTFAQGFDEWSFLASTDIAPTTIERMDDPQHEPWFVVAYWMGAHAPYNPPEEYDLWAVDGVDDINVTGCEGIDPSQYPEGWTCFNHLNSGDVEWTDREWSYVRALYDAEVRQHDDWLGQLWDALEQRGLSDTTLFAFTSDHGEALNDHGDMRAWHVWPTDDTQQVPLVVRFPGVFPATVHQDAVRTMDLYATFMRLTGGPATHPMDSRSLTQVVNGPSSDRVSVGATIAGDGRQWYRHDGYKIIYSREREEDNVQQLFDLTSDGTEQTNLWDSMPDKVEELKAAHAAYLEETAINR